MRELLGLLNLSRAQTLHIYESMKVIMVRKDEKLVFATFQVVAPSLKDFNDSLELLIMGLVAGLSRDNFLEEEDN